MSTPTHGFCATQGDQAVLGSKDMSRRCLTAIFGLLWVLFGSSLCLAVESHPGLEAEASYSEAVVAFHRKQVRESLQILNRLLDDQPDYVPALELKALNLKTLGKDEQLMEVYEELLKNKPEAERAPLYYELGSLQQRFKRPQEAKANLLRAIEGRFNLVPSHLLVGTIDFADGNLADAEAHFKYVRREGSSDMEMLATFYLGLINFKKGSGALGAGYILEARDLAAKKLRADPRSPMASELKAPIDQILDPFKKSQWFSNVSLLGQYDSNISQIPTAATSQQGTDTASSKSTMLAGFGYMSPPLAAVQWVPSYRFNTNKNFSETAHTLEYASNTASLALNLRPLGRISGGLKAELTHTFQNQLKDETDSTGGYVYRPYSLSADIGPSVKWVQGENLQLTADFSVRPQINYSQATLGGTGWGARLGYRRDGAMRYFNPSVSLGYDVSGTRDLEYASVAKSAGLSNLLRLPGDNQLTLGLDLGLTDYDQASSPRHDVSTTLKANLSRPVNATWTLLADLSYQANSSNIPGTYSFNRWQAGVGASFSR